MSEQNEASVQSVVRRPSGVIMLVKYSWCSKTQDPNEITSVEIDGHYVPREGELVEIDIEANDGARIWKRGRVKDVIWLVSKTTFATVILGD